MKSTKTFAFKTLCFLMTFVILLSLTAFSEELPAEELILPTEESASIDGTLVDSTEIQSSDWSCTAPNCTDPRPHTHTNVTVFDQISLRLTSVNTELSEVEKYFSIQDIDFLISALQWTEVRLLDEPTNTYNCHAYAWLQYTSYQTSYWLNSISDLLPNYNPHCVEVSYPSVGDIVVYIVNNKIEHSGIVHSVQNGEVIVRSKWGEAGLYEHELYHVFPDYYNEDDDCDIKFYDYWPIHNYSYSSVNSSNHTVTCTMCSETTVEPHTFQYTATSKTYHKKTCVKCSYTETQIPHTVVSAPYTDLAHLDSCADCGQNITLTSHTIEWVENDTGHGNMCTGCGYSTSFEAHTLAMWMPYNSYGHRRNCNGCDYYLEERHYEYYDPNAERCLRCGHTGNIVLTVPNHPHETE